MCCYDYEGNEGCVLYEDIYEDWDFWLQVSENTSFIHSDERTAFYRAGGDSDTATNDDGERFQTEHRLGKARAALFNKWKGKWGGEAINQMLKSAIRPDLAKKVSELANRLEEELKKSNLLETVIHERDAEIHERDAEIHERDAEIRERNAEIRERNQKLDQLRLIENSLRQKIDSFAREINSLGRDLNHKIEVEKNLKVHIGQLEAELNRVLSSKSWRVMGPIRRIGRFLTNGLKANRSRTSDAEQAEPKVSEVETKPDVTETILVTEKNAKEKYDEEAKSALDSFLDSKERLNFEKTGVPSVSIILVLYNQAQLSFLCLKSLLQKSDVAFELIIVDNASSDKTKELLAKIDNAIILHNQKNLGFVKAVNKAAGVAKTDFLLLLNNDALIHKRTLSYALDTLAIDETVGAVGGKIVLTDGTLQEAGSIIWQDGSCLGYGRGDDPDAAPYMFERDVDYCSGAFLLFRRNDFEELNGFDEDYAPAYYEDSDFCIRLQKKGFRIIYNPNVVITHYEFASSGGLSNASILQKKHQNIFCNKHSEWLKTKRSRDPQTTHLARTSNQFPNVLVIDDRIPHPSLGSGYPRAAHFVNSID
ncbi:MAG: hypothetical protein CMQ41_11210 [Gammaproteobacteria bacterium]|nr:hypothetical protein [Gammaproteobacteria bacterium]